MNHGAMVAVSLALLLAGLGARAIPASECAQADDGATVADVGRWLREGCDGTDWDCEMMGAWGDANCGPNGCAFGGDTQG